MASILLSRFYSQDLLLILVVTSFFFLNHIDFENLASEL